MEFVLAVGSLKEEILHLVTSLALLIAMIGIMSTRQY